MTCLHRWRTSRGLRALFGEAQFSGNKCLRKTLSSRHITGSIAPNRSACVHRSLHRVKDLITNFTNDANRSVWRNDLLAPRQLWERVVTSSGTLPRWRRPEVVNKELTIRYSARGKRYTTRGDSRRFVSFVIELLQPGAKKRRCSRSDQSANSKHTGVGISTRAPVALSRPVSASIRKPTTDSDRWLATSS